MNYIDLHCDALTAEGVASVTAENLRAGGCALQCFAAFVNGTKGEGFARALALCDKFDEMCAREGYRTERKGGAAKICALLTVEGGEAIEGNLEHLKALRARGVTMLGLTWNMDNALGHCATPLFLSPSTSFLSPSTSFRGVAEESRPDPFLPEENTVRPLSPSSPRRGTKGEEPQNNVMLSAVETSPYDCCPPPVTPQRSPLTPSSFSGTKGEEPQNNVMLSAVETSPYASCPTPATPQRSPLTPSSVSGIRGEEPQNNVMLSAVETSPYDCCPPPVTPQRSPQSPSSANGTKGAGRQFGLTPFGRACVEAMCAMGMIADVSHGSDGLVKDVAEICLRHGVPFVASHSNARAVFPHPRNLTDEGIRLIAESGGVVGLCLVEKFLSSEGTAAGQRAALLAHARHIMNVGGEDVLALGTDFDGAPANSYIGSPAEMPNLLSDFERAFGPRLAEKIAYRNAQRLFE